MRLPQPRYDEENRGSCVLCGMRGHNVRTCSEAEELDEQELKKLQQERARKRTRGEHGSGSAAVAMVMESLISRVERSRSAVRYELRLGGG